MINYSITLLLCGLGIIISQSFGKVLTDSEYAITLEMVFWTIVGYIYMVDRSKEYQFQVIIAIVAIFYSGLKYSTDQMYKGLYVFGWIYLGYLTGLVNGKINKNKMMLGMSAAALMIASNFVFIPLQSQSCRVEGPGMAFKGVAWSLLAYSVQ